MVLLQLAALIGSVVLFVALFQLHKTVVRKYVLPEVIDEDEREK